MQAKDAKLAELTEAKRELTQDLDRKDRALKNAEQRVRELGEMEAKLKEQLAATVEQLAAKVLLTGLQNLILSTERRLGQRKAAA